MCTLPQTSRCRSTEGAAGWGGRGCRSDPWCQALRESQSETYTLTETESELDGIRPPLASIICNVALLHITVVPSLGTPRKGCKSERSDNDNKYRGESKNLAKTQNDLLFLYSLLFACENKNTLVPSGFKKVIVLKTFEKRIIPLIHVSTTHQCGFTLCRHKLKRLETTD